MIRGYLRDVVSDPAFWAGICLMVWCFGLIMLGAGR